MARVFKAMAEAAGIARDLVATISGHSSRVGAAQDQVRHGVELPAVMQAGGWTSPTMVARYSARLPGLLEQIAHDQGIDAGRLVSARKRS